MMARLLPWTAAILTVVSPLSVQADKTWSLLHSVDGVNFMPRGQVILSVSPEKNAEISFADAVEGDEEDDAGKLDAAAVESMVQYGLYQLKLVEDGTNNYVMASVPACQIKRANFRDELEILLNERGSAVSLTYTPLVSKLAPPCNQVEINPDGVTFISKVQYETSTPGMTLPKVLPTSNPQLGLSFFPRAQGGKPIPGATPDRPPIGGPMGFLMKYWYIALPLFIVGMMGPGEEEPAQQQQGGGRAGPSAGGAAAAAAGAGAAAAASGGGGGGVRRRGKRG